MYTRGSGVFARRLAAVAVAACGLVAQVADHEVFAGEPRRDPVFGPLRARGRHTAAVVSEAERERNREALRHCECLERPELFMAGRYDPSSFEGDDPSLAEELASRGLRREAAAAFERDAALREAHTASERFDPRWAAESWARAAELHLATGDGERCDAASQKALALLGLLATADVPGLAIRLALVRRGRGDPIAAELAARALAAVESVPDRPNAGSELELLVGEWLAGEGRLAEAEAWTARASRGSNGPEAGEDEDEYEAMVRLQLAGVKWLRGDLEGASKLVGKVRSTRDAVLASRVALHLEKGEYLAAVRTAERALRLARERFSFEGDEEPSVEQLATNHALVGTALWHRGDYRGSVEHYEHALALLDGREAPPLPQRRCTTARVDDAIAYHRSRAHLDCARERA